MRLGTCIDGQLRLETRSLFSPLRVFVSVSIFVFVSPCKPLYSRTSAEAVSGGLIAACLPSGPGLKDHFDVHRLRVVSIVARSK